MNINRFPAYTLNMANIINSLQKYFVKEPSFSEGLCNKPLSNKLRVHHLQVYPQKS